jgi:hypothetical protein
MATAARENLEHRHAALHEKWGQEAALAWLAANSGYTEKTLQTYVTKNMVAPHVVRSSTTTYPVRPDLLLPVGVHGRCTAGWWQVHGSHTCSRNFQQEDASNAK